MRKISKINWKQLKKKKLGENHFIWMIKYKNIDFAYGVSISLMFPILLLQKMTRMIQTIQ